MDTRWKGIGLRGRGRKSFTWAAEQLTKSGIHVSTESLRRYSRLLPRPLNRIGTQGERQFTPGDLEQVACIVVLKQLGLTDEEVKTWLENPQESRLGDRVKYVRNITARARELCLSAERSSTASGNDGLSAPATPSGAQPSTEGTTQTTPNDRPTNGSHG